MYDLSCLFYYSDRNQHGHPNLGLLGSVRWLRQIHSPKGLLLYPQQYRNFDLVKVEPFVKELEVLLLRLRLLRLRLLRLRLVDLSLLYLLRMLLTLRQI